MPKIFEGNFDFLVPKRPQMMFFGKFRRFEEVLEKIDFSTDFGQKKFSIFGPRSGQIESVPGSKKSKKIFPKIGQKSTFPKKIFSRTSNRLKSTKNIISSRFDAEKHEISVSNIFGKKKRV